MKSMYPDFQWENSHEVMREQLVMVYTKSVIKYIVSEKAKASNVRGNI